MSESSSSAQVVSNREIDMAREGLRDSWYSTDPLWILVCVALVIQFVRIMTVAAQPHGETPFLSANDRSRWCTIASLTEDGSFVIDRFLDKRDSSGKFRTWYSIDMVRKTEVDGEEHYYSSKPPLLSVMYAAICSPISSIWNRRLSDAPLEVGRTLLIVTQWLPMAVFWIGCWMWAVRSVSNVWNRTVLVCFILFGTFLTTFTSTLNNHLPAAIAMAASLVLLRWAVDENGVTIRAILCCLLLGGAASFTAICDLPALAWAAILVPLIAILSGSIAKAVWTSAGMVPLAVAFAVTNWIAYGDLKPPYAHRELLGPQIATLPLKGVIQKDALIEPTKDDLLLITEVLRNKEEAIGEPINLRKARRAGTWEASFQSRSNSNDSQASQTKRYAVVREGDRWSIHQWNDWYDYPKSYWLPENKRGVDLGEPNIGLYALHILVGHHGVLSLTPIWIFSMVGLIACLRDRSNRMDWWIAAAIAIVTIVCLSFYISRPLIDRNYGGVASGFRWLFWLIPAWILLLPKGLDLVCRTYVGKYFVVAALLVSVFWATIPWNNPWQSPLLFTWFQ